MDTVRRVGSLRVLRWSPGSTATEVAVEEIKPDGDAWLWIDADTSDSEQLIELGEQLGLDRLAVADAVEDLDTSKVDDFGEHMLVVLHGLSESSEDEVETYELDMFITDRVLVSVRSGRSRSVDHLWAEAKRNADFSDVGPDVLAARIASVIMRRWASIVTSFDEQLDELIDRALVADRDVLRDVTFLRTELSTIRATLRPQLETLAELRNSASPLVGQRSQRRFSDAFDTATRIDHAIEGVRAELLAALDAYRGAEARTATEISRVLTIYAAILLPLSFVVGFFGMNVPNLPGADSEHAWRWITAAMIAMTIASLAVFARAGWITLPRASRPSSIVRRTFERARRPINYGRSLNLPLDGKISRRRSGK